MGMKASFMKSLSGEAGIASRVVNRNVIVAGGLAGVGVAAGIHAGRKKREQRLGLRSIGRVAQVSSGGLGQYMPKSMGGSTGF